jgi:hypothetical protein
MKQPIKGQDGLMACPSCGRTQFQVPHSDISQDSLFCDCGKRLGPYQALVHCADGISHTAGIAAKLVPTDLHWSPELRAIGYSRASIGLRMR